MRHWHIGRRAAIAFAIMLVVLGVALQPFLRPTGEPNRKADAIVALSDDRGVRLAYAQQLAQRGFAPNLGVSVGNAGMRSIAERTCSQQADYATVCFVPQPATTKGEASSIRSLATRRQWKSVIVVTATFHAPRARVLMRRCLGTSVAVVGVHQSVAIWKLPFALTHELIGLAHARLIDRSC
jgi:uncharacterized SAM-binding protein YcdF (DUF218 family)